MLGVLKASVFFLFKKLVADKIMDFIMTSRRQSPETSQPDQLCSPVLASFSFFPS
jgi:hypothetical protein